MEVPGEETLTPRAFHKAQGRGPVCRTDSRHEFWRTERHCVVKLMRPQGQLTQQVDMAPSTSAPPGSLGRPENSGMESPGPSPGLLWEGLQDGKP